MTCKANLDPFPASLKITFSSLRTHSMETDFLFFRSLILLRFCCQCITQTFRSASTIKASWYTFKFILTRSEDGTKRSGDVMQQPDGLMAAQPLSTWRGQGLKSQQKKKKRRRWRIMCVNVCCCVKCFSALLNCCCMSKPGLQLSFYRRVFIWMIKTEAGSDRH